MQLRWSQCRPSSELPWSPPPHPSPAASWPRALQPWTPRGCHGHRLQKQGVGGRFTAAHHSSVRDAGSLMEYPCLVVCTFSSGLFGELRIPGLVDFLTQLGLRQVPPPPSREAVQPGARAPPPAAPAIQRSTHPSQVPSPTVQPNLPPGGETSCGGASAWHRPPGESPQARTKSPNEARESGQPPCSKE